MSMFGWGGGDIFAIYQLAVKVYTAYKDAPGDDYRHILDEVKSLQFVINMATRHFQSTKLNTNSQQEGQKVLKGCQNILEDLNKPAPHPPEWASWKRGDNLLYRRAHS